MSTRLHIDLTGSTDPTLGPEWLSVIVVGEWDGWPAGRLRAEAAEHFKVPVEQVGHPEPAEWPEDPDEPA
jgi:hypothetical protein